MRLEPPSPSYHFALKKSQQMIYQKSTVIVKKVKKDRYAAVLNL